MTDNKALALASVLLIWGVRGLVVNPHRLKPATWPHSRAKRLLWRHQSNQPAASEQAAASRELLPVLWRFSRPHTLIGTAVCVPALHALAAPSLAAGFTQQFWLSIFWALLPATLVNIFITGLNQVSDVDIDKVNKPHLPIAAGELSEDEGAMICVACLLLATGIALCSPLASQPLSAVLGGSAALGAAYSLPPLRFKRWPLLAAFSIVAIRGALINICFYAHAVAVAFQGTPFLPRAPAEARIGLVVAFFGLFGVAIALMKDVPDVEGDQQFKIRTLTIKFGRAAVFKFAATLVTAVLVSASVILVGAAIAARSAALTCTRLFAAVASAALAKDAFDNMKSVNPNARESVSAYYMRIWRLFYLSYLFLPFAR